MLKGFLLYSLRIMRTRESGIFTHWCEAYEFMSSATPANSHVKVLQLSLDHIFGFFQLYLSGAAFSVVVALCERCLLGRRVRIIIV